MHRRLLESGGISSMQPLSNSSLPRKHSILIRCMSGHTKNHRATLQSPHHAIHIYEPPWWRDATSYRNLRHESWSRDLSLIIIKRQNFTVFSWSNPFSFDLTVPSHFPFYSPSKHAALPPR